jgi:phage terminase large subunit
VNAVLAPAVFDREFYDGITRERARRLKYLRGHPAEVRKLKRYYRSHIADMVNDWGVTVDPRNVRKGLPVVMPFVLDKRQREWIEFTVENWRDGEYGGTEKSRDVGVSWLIVGTSICIASVYDDVAIGWGSFKREKVDWRGDMGSLFEKGRNYLEWLPEEFRGGHVVDTCSFDRRLLFPETGGVIIGEIGDNIGRGNRTSIYFVDEAAHLEHDQIADMALSKTTDCRQDVSSVRGMDNSFAERMHKKGTRKFTFHWRHNPRMSQADYDKFLDTWGPVVTAQELDINYSASLEGILIPAVWANAVVDAHLKIKDFPAITGERLASLDVADQGIDKNAGAIRHGILLEHVEEWTGKESDIYATVERAFLMCDLHNCHALRYDGDGVGAGVRGDARKVNEARAAQGNHRVIVVKPFRGSGEVLDPEREMVPGRKNKDFFLNFKAQAWWWLRMLFQNTFRAVNGQPYEREMLISISSAMAEKARLLIQISQPTYSQNQAGKLLVDKQPDGTASPNLGDAVMMVYAPARRPMRIDERNLTPTVGS